MVFPLPCSSHVRGLFRLKDYSSSLKALFCTDAYLNLNLNLNLILAAKSANLECFFDSAPCRNIDFAVNGPVLRISQYLSFVMFCLRTSTS
jgi:hypothetical protein